MGASRWPPFNGQLCFCLWDNKTVYCLWVHMCVSEAESGVQLLIKAGILASLLFHLSLRFFIVTGRQNEIFVVQQHIKGFLSLSPFFFLRQDFCAYVPMPFFLCLSQLSSSLLPSQAKIHSPSFLYTLTFYKCFLPPSLVWHSAC